MKPIGRAVAWSAVASLLVVGGIAGCQGRGSLGGTPYYGPGSAPVPAPSSLKNNVHTKRLYVANSGSNDIFIAAFDPSGAIFPINTNNIPTGNTPLAIAGHPAIPFMVVCNAMSGDLWSYVMDIPTGNLTRFGTPVSIGASPVAMKWSPNGKFLYVLAQGANGPTLQTFNFDTTTQTFTSTNHSTTVGNISGGGVNPQTGQPGGPQVAGTATALALAPGGNFAYVGISTPDLVAVVKLAPDGSTTQVGKLVNGGPTQSCIAPYPGGRFVWITNGGSGDLNLYTLDPQNNLQQNPTPIKCGQFPIDMAIDNLGKAAYVVNAKSGDVNMFSIQGPSGTLDTLGAIGGLAQQMQGTTPWQGQGLPDNVVAVGGITPMAMAVNDDRTFSYLLNIGAPGMPPIPPFVTIYQIMDGQSNPIGQVPAPSSPPPQGSLWPIMMPTQAVPNGQNPVVCGSTPGSFFPQPDDITIY